MNNKFFPSNFLFIMIMLMGTLFTLSSSHWLTMWMGLELNLMGFLPLMNIKGKTLEAESSMKYFIIQSLSSSLLIMASIMMYYFTLSWYSMFSNTLISILIIFSLTLKLGGAPLHFWLPSITKKMAWLTLFLLLTWQKLAPLLMMTLMNSNTLIITTISIISTIVGSLMALNQTNLQLIITYSSISHLGWMLSSITFNNSITLVYFFNYVLISIPLLNMLSKTSGDHLFMLTQKNNMNNLIIVSLILSLAGLPPLLGFMSKFIILLSLIQNNMIILTIIMFLGTLISLYFYLNLSLMMMIKSYMMLSTKKADVKHNLILSTNVLSSLVFFPFMMMLIKYAMNILYKP
uniref:NADH dehydrogenase subunit 2 n=1 Tax=Abraliopsis morisii TaxID=2718909 RepID=UPI00286B222E|nr:NADH dehydrogenase subunit 2 [Abraliopsis morisii]WMC20979.1 NADH dehydrogenase subunit 2 [Abraliopsis morisii]